MTTDSNEYAGRLQRNASESKKFLFYGFTFLVFKKQELETRNQKLSNQCHDRP
jgi:hypothetical protein